jgi:hypothetical protein
VPTHRDYPWERDQRAAEQDQGRSPDIFGDADLGWDRQERSRPGRRKRHSGGSGGSRRAARQSLSRGQVLAAVVSLAATAVLTLPRQLAAPDAAITPLARSQVRVAGSVTQLRTRFLDGRTLRIWGRTTAPDGSPVSLWIAADGMAAHELAVRATAGRFSTRARIPQPLRNRRVRVRAAVAP